MSEEKKTVVTPTGRIVFLKNLFVPNDKEKYTCSLLFKDSQDLTELKDLMLVKAREKFHEKDIKSKKFSWGIKTPDEDAIDKYDFFDKETIVLNAATKFEVDVVGSTKGSDGKYIPLIDGDLKAGDFCRFIVSAYAWEYEGKKGVSLNLNGVQLIKEGEALYARRETTSVFDEVSFDVEPEAKEVSSEDSEDMMGW